MTLFKINCVVCKKDIVGHSFGLRDKYKDHILNEHLDTELGREYKKSLDEIYILHSQVNKLYVELHRLILDNMERVNKEKESD